MGPMLPPPTPSPPTVCFNSSSPHSCVSSPARPPQSVVHPTTIQSITITSRKENPAEERRSWTDSTPPPALSSPSAPPPLQPTLSPSSPPAQPSLLASLLARKRSVVTVPASAEADPPTRGSSRPSPDRLPYLPHAPFHLFSYDLDEEPSPPASAQPAEESPKTTSPRSDRTIRMLQSPTFRSDLFTSHSYIPLCTYPSLCPFPSSVTSWSLPIIHSSFPFPTLSTSLRCRLPVSPF